jgi:hypothetical protein
MFQSFAGGAVATFEAGLPIAPVVPEFDIVAGSGVPDVFSLVFVQDGGRSANATEDAGRVTLPPGLQLDSRSGVINGTPTLPTSSAGDTYRLVARNADGASNSLLTIIVVPNKAAAAAAAAAAFQRHFSTIVTESRVADEKQLFMQLGFSGKNPTAPPGYHGPVACLRCIEEGRPCFGLTSDGASVLCESAETSGDRCRAGTWRCPTITQQVPTAAANGTHAHVGGQNASVPVDAACAHCVAKNAACRSERATADGQYFCYFALHTASTGKGCPAKTVKCHTLKTAKRGAQPLRSPAIAALQAQLAKLVGAKSAPTNKCPKLSLVGPALIVLSEGFPYVDEGATAVSATGHDLSAKVTSIGNTVTVAAAFEKQRSCLHILRAARRRSSKGVVMPSGWYFITRFALGGSGKSDLLRVWCDMASDGGGYTIAPVEHGLPTARIADANSCQRMGMQMAVPRTPAHMLSMLHHFGAKYFASVPGVYGLFSGTAASHIAAGLPMSSASNDIGNVWKALDGGGWWLGRSTAPGQPSTSYTAGCWLKLDGWTPRCSSSSVGAPCLRYRAATKCSAVTTQYLCSTNDKDPLSQQQQDFAATKKAAESAVGVDLTADACNHVEFVNAAPAQQQQQKRQQQLVGVFRLVPRKLHDGRPVYRSLSVGGMEFEKNLGIEDAGDQSLYLFYSEQHDNWVVADEVGGGSVLLLISSTALSPASIKGTWLLVGNTEQASRQFAPLPTLQVECTTVQSDGTSGGHAAASDATSIGGGTAAAGKYIITYDVRDQVSPVGCLICDATHCAPPAAQRLPQQFQLFGAALASHRRLLPALIISFPSRHCSAPPPARATHPRLAALSAKLCGARWW